MLVKECILKQSTFYVNVIANNTISLIAVAYLKDNVAAIFFMQFCILSVGYSDKYIIFAHIIHTNKINKVMASIAQLVSEIAHSVKQPDSVPVRRAIKLGIIHARNEAIRRSYGNHNYTDKVLQQRFRLTLTDVPDGDLAGSQDIVRDKVKRTTNKVPRPTRLINNLPFHSVRTSGMKKPIEIAFVKEASAQYYSKLPGMCPVITYDYINEYIYINIPENSKLTNVGSIIVESVFEYPHLIQTETVDRKLDLDSIDDNDEFLLPEDMIDTIKKFVLETWNTNVIRDTNEVPSPNIVS